MYHSTLPTKDDFEILSKIATTAHESKYFEKQGNLQGIFCLALYAHEIGRPPMAALFGGLHNINGKIVMSSEMIHAMIREAGHGMDILECSFSKCCIKGTRKETGESYTCSYSLEEAKRAGLVRPGSVWEKFPDSMMFARCVSTLRRRLFPDIASRAYVEGEIEPEDVKEATKKAEVVVITEQVSHLATETPQEIKTEQDLGEPKAEEAPCVINSEEALSIESLIHPEDLEYRENLLAFSWKRSNEEPRKTFEGVKHSLLKSIIKSTHKRAEALLREETSNTSTACN